MTDHNHQFWSRLDDINSGMLGVTQDSRLVPMSHYTDRKVGVLWFITARDTDLARSVASGPQDAMHVVSDGGQGLYARIHGTLSLSDNRAKLDELWNAVASSWFEDGKQDPDVQLLRLDLTEAEVWATGGSMAFLYQIAKSKITGDKPDMGDHYSLTF
ncbi:pyridoxamine 5'-phosphate oxidase family protein [Paracoccus sp. 08]|uniref:pyridoxamine 5'-phosphate oxidase family protein n=1 Tax=Paracoccus sp. 08 TaxID=2606624 RepID=UPI0020962ABB|nr:pyridoxamine 5'-phosphate oxidase family protein [Paracoccus sp. 08]MCO6363935.1 general stress protein [Paracoccus sp. 08]